MSGWSALTRGPVRLVAVEGNHLWPLNDGAAKREHLSQVVAFLRGVMGDQRASG